MQPFQFTKAQHPEAAIKGGTAPSAKFVAGGTNLIDLMKLDVETPKQVIDINQLGMNQVTALPNGNIRIGALVKNSDLAYHPLIVQKHPVLSEALLSGASAQLRNMASTGGNILQRTRCPYFYDTAFACNKRQPGSGCPAMDGYNRNHAVLGVSDHCIAAHPSDMCVAMAALGAIVHTQGVSGTRTIPFTDFHLLPGQTPHLENALKPGELITAVEIPNLPFAGRSHYLKVRDRASYEFALTSAAVILDINGGIIRNARIAMGGVGTKPWRSFAAEKALTGRPANVQTYQQAAAIALQDAKPHQHNAFKIELAKRTLVRALTTAAEKTV
jgi:xanthine dehydrogenase YagS FAD-binding subunit